MESTILEKLSSGLLFLYTAGGRKDLCIYLDHYFAELFHKASFSVLSVTDEPGVYLVEHSTGIDLPAYERQYTRCRELDVALSRRTDTIFSELSPPAFSVQGQSLPLRILRLLDWGPGASGVVVFHDLLEPQIPGELEGLTDYVLDHVVTAFQLAGRHDLQADLLECSQAKLDGISEIISLVGQFELPALLIHLISVYTRLTEAQVGSIVLEGKVNTDIEWGLPRAALDLIREKGGTPLHRIATETRSPVLVRGYSSDPRFEPLPEFNLESYLSIPLITKQQVLGTVNLANGRAGGFTEMDRAAMLTISSIAAGIIENAILHNDLIEKERIKASLQLARSIQQGMYPTRALEIPGYELAWVTQSCDETGGDYLDFFPMGATETALAVGDVSGHGIGAALLMASGRANLRALLSVKSDLADVVGRLNDLLGADLDGAKFMTLFLAALDASRHTVTYVNAGHDQPFLYRAADGSVDQCETTGLPVGMMPGWTYEKRSTRSLEPGDCLLITTDGVWEAASRTGERFGKARLKDSLVQHAGRAPRELIDAILKDVLAYTRGVPHPDDVTVLLLKRVQ